MRILVTGINGFVGKHLCAELKNHNHYVIGTGLEETLSDNDALVDEYIGGVNLTVAESVQTLPLANIDAVINLAALAQVGASFGKLDEYVRVNTLVQTNLAELLLRQNKKARLLAISSGAIYDSAQSMPLSETARIATDASPYAQSKIAMEQELQRFQKHGLDVVIARPFNHIGPGQLPGFLVPDLVSQLQKGSKITVGNLDTSRDYTDVRDVVRAYRLLVEAEKIGGVYNVCSGHSVSGRTILNNLIELMKVDDPIITVDQTKIRPSDPQDIYGDNSKLVHDTGWKPTIPLIKTLADITQASA